MSRTQKIKHGLKDWLKAGVISIALLVSLKAFIGDVHTIDSSSMEGTLLSGDIVWVSKWIYGLRVPSTPLSIPFTHQRIPGTFIKSYTTFVELPYFRWEWNKVKRNEVLAFHYPLDLDHPLDHKLFFIKRCIGLPGDTIEIWKGQVIANQKYIKDHALVKNEFEVQFKSDFKPDWAYFNKLGIREGGLVSSGDNTWQLSLLQKQIDTLKGNPFVVSIVKVPHEEPLNDVIFPHDSLFAWSEDYFGPIFIPKKGAEIILDSMNFALYQRLIELYENQMLEYKDEVYYLNGKPCASYTFKSDYYFMLGDNRHNSQDSRFWGLVPESHLIGKVTHVVYSLKEREDFKDRFRLRRFFEKV